MVSVRLAVQEIDYTACIRNLLPQIVEHLTERNRPYQLEQLIVKLGPDAVPVAEHLLAFLGQDDKDELLVWLLTSQEARLKASANRHLAEILGEGVLRIGWFSAWNRPGSRLELLASDVSIDYPALLRSPAVAQGVEQLGGESGFLKGAAKLALQMGAHLQAETLEKRGLAFLQSEGAKKKLLPSLENALRQAGLYAKFEDLVVEAGDVISLPERLPGEEADKLPAPLADALTDALIRWMRETCRQTS